MTEERRFVSRGGLKLQAALDAFDLHPTGWRCADFGCSTGGFTDCLLQARAAKVFAVDTGYGVLDWKLRNDPRVVVMERTNALHTDPPPELVAAGLAHLVVVDLSWTRQQHALPACRRWLASDGLIVTLIKPHYEHDSGARARRGVLEDQVARDVVEGVCARICAMGFSVDGLVESPIRGGKGKSTGNREYLALVRVDPRAGASGN